MNPNFRRHKNRVKLKRNYGICYYDLFIYYDLMQGVQFREFHYQYYKYKHY